MVGKNEESKDDDGGENSKDDGFLHSNGEMLLYFAPRHFHHFQLLDEN